MPSIPYIFGITNWSLTLISIILFIGVFILYVKIFQEEREKDVSTLLVMNTCLSAFLTSVTVVLMVSSNIFQDYLLTNMRTCHIVGLLYDIFECSIYYSYSLQAIYRLCRVIYYKKRLLLSFKLYQILILLQWLLTVLLLLPTYFLNWYIRLPTENYCLIPYTDLIASFYLILVLYLIPLLTVIIIYILITKHIRSAVNLRINERQRNQRDLTVIKRIIICVVMLVFLRFPTIIFILVGVINGYLYYLTYPIVGFVTAVCLILISLITISVTKKFQDRLFDYFSSNHNQVQPAANPTGNTN